MVDIYPAAKRRGKYPPLAADGKVNSSLVYTKTVIWMISSLVADANREAIFSRVALR